MVVEMLLFRVAMQSPRQKGFMVAVLPRHRSLPEAVRCQDFSALSFVWGFVGVGACVFLRYRLHVGPMGAPSQDIRCRVIVMRVICHVGCGVDGFGNDMVLGRLMERNNGVNGFVRIPRDQSREQRPLETRS